MRIINISGLVAAILSLSLVSPKSQLSEVVELTESTFDKFIASNNITLVEYFAPWCGHCKQLSPEYEKAASLLNESGVKLANINCDDSDSNNTKFCAAQGIRGYPTLKVFKNGKESLYEGRRDADSIVAYMKRQVLPAVSQIRLGGLAEFSKGDEVVVVTILPPNSKEEQAFSKVAESLRNEHTFGSIQPGIYMFKKFDEGLATFDGKEITSDALKNWISTESTPLMAELSPDNYQKYINSGLPMAYLFYEKEPMRSEYGGIVKEIMREYKGKINAVYIDAERFETHADSLALPKSWPGFVIHKVEGDLKYPFKGKLNKEELGRFVSDFVKDKIEPTYRSEEIPAKDDGPVKTVVYKNFEKVVMDASKDVLLKLYAPWCGACKRVAPIYEDLAKTYEKQTDKIVIAKMDATVNDLPKDVNINLTGYPTFVLFKASAKAGPKELVEMKQIGDSVKAFADFIGKHAFNKVDITINESPKDPKENEEL